MCGFTLLRCADLNEEEVQVLLTFLRLDEENDFWFGRKCRKPRPRVFWNEEGRSWQEHALYLSLITYGTYIL